MKNDYKPAPKTELNSHHQRQKQKKNNNRIFTTNNKKNLTANAKPRGENVRMDISRRHLSLVALQAVLQESVVAGVG